MNGRDIRPSAVVSSVKASPPSGIRRHSPAKQNQSSPAFVNFHFVFGDFVPVNSKKCDAGTRQRPTGNRRPSERKLMTGGPLGRLAENPPQFRELVRTVFKAANDWGAISR